MTKDPVTAKVYSSNEEILRTIRLKLIDRTDGKKLITRFVPLVDEKMKILMS